MRCLLLGLITSVGRRHHAAPPLDPVRAFEDHTCLDTLSGEIAPASRRLKGR